MDNKQLQLVTHEQARRLKKAGFNTPCSMYYASTGRVGQYGYLYDDNQDDGGCSAPTVALAIKWLRDVKGIDGNTLLNGKGRYFWYNPTRDDCSCDFDTYEQAESALLDELLALIEENKLNP